jgi:phosphoribosylformylglycinamidine synthase
MHAAVIVFPGSNCDRDVLVACQAQGVQASFVWHKETMLPKNIDLVILPGGFSYGDHLRSGAISAHSAVMHEVIAFANRGGYVLGICNGFQVLTESGLLPGALTRNISHRFICKTLPLKVETNSPIFLSHYTENEVIHLPVAHAEGCYMADDDTLDRLEGEGRIALRYVNAQGGVHEADNPNGSLRAIAGIFNAGKNVMGLMPHPERAADALTGGVDGARLLQAFAQ